MPEYRVDLDIYNGPVDLLLYLIRREEVDIYDIPIARITQQYVQYVEMIQELDPNLAGEFLVLAATLIEIKSRMLLPSAPLEEAGPDGSALDPRAELVRQLLEYKAFKDAANQLQAGAQQMAMRYPRRPPALADTQGEYDLEDVQVWNLLDAFTSLMTSIGQLGRQHEVIYDDTPVELHASDILDRLSREGSLSFAKVFEGRTRRSEIVGLFIALLELTRQKKVRAVQDGNFGEIMIVLRTDAPPRDQPTDDTPSDSLAASASSLAASREASEGSFASQQASATQPTDAGLAASEVIGEPPADASAQTVAGQYVPEQIAQEDNDDDSGTEACGTGD